MVSIPYTQILESQGFVTSTGILFTKSVENTIIFPTVLRQIIIHVAIEWIYFCSLGPLLTVKLIIIFSRNHILMELLPSLLILSIITATCSHFNVSLVLCICCFLFCCITFTTLQCINTNFALHKNAFFRSEYSAVDVNTDNPPKWCYSRALCLSPASK